MGKREENHLDWRKKIMCTESTFKDQRGFLRGFVKADSLGFTLIELLIVVAIIAILAAIAVPNFIEAQTRSKVTRVKADMRALVTALEAYRVDYNSYTFENDDRDTVQH